MDQISLSVQMLRYTLMLGLVAWTQAWVLDVNVDRITPDVTHDVELTCKHNDTNGKSSPIKSISRIRITKKDPFGSIYTFAEIRELQNATFKGERKDHNVVVTGDINDHQRAFLRVTWTTVTTNTAGAYGCEVDGYDQMHNFGNVKVNPTLIKERILTEQDVKKFIQKATTDNDKKRQKLEIEIANFKTFIVNDLNVMKEQIQSLQKTFISKITKLEDDAKSKFVSRDEIAKQVSEIKTFIINEVISDNKNDENQHNVIRQLIITTNQSLNSRLSELQSEYSNANAVLETKIESLDKKNENVHQKVNSTVVNLDMEIHSIDAKYERILTDLRSDLSLALSGVIWPRGNYGMVRSGEECPDLKSVTLKEPFTYGDPFIEARLFNGSSLQRLVFCMQADQSSSLMTWPKGTYCIYTSSSCPKDFTKSMTWLTAFKEKVTKAKVGMGHCCKSDGPADSPIRLPSKIPFYLYRYNGTCQMVEGMHESHHSINLYLGNSSDDVTLKQQSPHPDTDSHGNKIQLCSYQLKTG